MGVCPRTVFVSRTRTVAPLGAEESCHRRTRGWIGSFLVGLFGRFMVGPSKRAFFEGGLSLTSVDGLDSVGTAVEAADPSVSAGRWVWAVPLTVFGWSPLPVGPLKGFDACRSLCFPDNEDASGLSTGVCVPVVRLGPKAK